MNFDSTMQQLTPATLRTVLPDGIYELAIADAGKEHPSLAILPDYVQGAMDMQDVERVAKATATYFNRDVQILFRRIA